MSLDNATALAPQIQLTGLIHSLAPSGVDVNRVIVMAPSYLKDLAKILDHTSTETLRNYFFWKVVQVLSPYVEADALTPYKQFSNELQGRVTDSIPALSIFS
jgi:endothelin-converting enzyme